MNVFIAFLIGLATSALVLVGSDVYGWWLTIDDVLFGALGVLGLAAGLAIGEIRNARTRPY